MRGRRRFQRVKTLAAGDVMSVIAGQALPQTDRIMACLFDMRLPLTFSEDDCALIAELIGEAVYEVAP